MLLTISGTLSEMAIRVSTEWQIRWSVPSQYQQAGFIRVRSLDIVHLDSFSNFAEVEVHLKQRVAGGGALMSAPQNAGGKPEPLTIWE
jgi:hypothetical protein